MLLYPVRFAAPDMDAWGRGIPFVMSRAVVCLCKIYAGICFSGLLAFGGLVFFHALSAAGQARRRSVHNSPHLDPGRAPWLCS